MFNFGIPNLNQVRTLDQVGKVRDLALVHYMTFAPGFFFENFYQELSFKSA